jgi:ribosomal protein S6
MTNTEETSNGELQTYEIGYLVLPSIPEEGLKAVSEKLTAAIEKAGGKEIDGEAPIMTDLAYAMDKTVGASKYVANEAYIGWTKFEISPSMALGLKSAVESIDELLRFLLIKVPRETSFTFAKAQAMIEEKEAKAFEEAKAGEEAPRATSEAVVE